MILFHRCKKCGCQTHWTFADISSSCDRMAVNDRRNDDTLYLNVLCFGKMAEALKEHLTRGRLVGVQGKIKVDDYQDKEGNPRNSVCVMADEISLGPTASNAEKTST